ITARGQVVGTHAPWTTKFIRDRNKPRPVSGLGVRGDTFALAFNGLVGVRLIVESPDADLDDALADLRLCFERVTSAKLSDGPTDAKGGAIRVRRIDAPDGW